MDVAIRYLQVLNEGYIAYVKLAIYGHQVVANMDEDEEALYHQLQLMDLNRQSIYYIIDYAI